MKKISIKQVEPHLAQDVETPLKTALKQHGYTVPEGSKLRVSLLRANGRKQPSNASASTWAPGTGRMQFWLEPSSTEEEASPAVDSSHAKVATAPDTAQAEGSQSSTSAGVQVHPAEA